MSKVRGIIMDIKELNDQDIARLEKLPKYRELGVDPFGKAYKISHHSDEIRKLCNYPPYKRMTKIMFSSVNKNDALNEAIKIIKRFKDVYKDIIVLGPTEDSIPKMADRYRINILLKYDFDIKDSLNKMNSFYQDKEISISIIEE